MVPEQYALSWRFTRLLSDVPAPALAINYIASSTPEVPAAKTSASKLRALVEETSADDLTKIKVGRATEFHPPSAQVSAAAQFEHFDHHIATFHIAGHPVDLVDIR